MKQIGIDVTSAITQGGGIGRYTRELVRALVNQDKVYQFTLFSAKQPAHIPVSDPLPKSKNIQYKPTFLNERWLYRLWYRLRLPLPVQLATGRLDLFHSPDFVLPPVAGNIPTLLTVHDLSFIHYPHVYPSKLVEYLNTVVPWSVARATHVLADSEATKRDLMQIWQVPESKITVLYCGVEATFRPEVDEARITAVRHKYKIGTHPYLLSVGTVQPRKNYQLLIRAFKPVAERWPHHLVIAGGRGWLYDEMMAEVGRQGLDGRVHFIGFVDDADLPVLYSSAALFLFPSLYEGFGLPLLEAMGCGVPVVTSNASSLPEVVGEEKKSAVLLNPEDEAGWSRTIDMLLNNSQRRTQLVAAGFLRAREFRWQKTADQLLSVYKGLLS